MPRVLVLAQKPVGEAAWELIRSAPASGVEVVGVVSNAEAGVVWWRSNRVFESRGVVPFLGNRERAEDELIGLIREQRVDVLLSVQHPWILTARVLESVDHAINFHNAPLPAYRGFNAVNHALLDSEPSFACTAHWMVPEVDEGEIAFEYVFPIAPEETAFSLYAKAHLAALRIFAEAIERLSDGRPIPRRELTGANRFFPRDSIAGLRTVRGGDAAELARRARAFYFPPFEPAHLEADGTTYLLPSHYALVASWGLADWRSVYERMLEHVEPELGGELR
jgi:methionyl-tRNA formyltransferase